MEKIKTGFSFYTILKVSEFHGKYTVIVGTPDGKKELTFEENEITHY